MRKKAASWPKLQPTTMMQKHNAHKIFYNQYDLILTELTCYIKHKEGKTCSGIGLKFSLMYPSDGGINALLFPEISILLF